MWFFILLIRYLCDREKLASTKAKTDHCVHNHNVLVDEVHFPEDGKMQNKSVIIAKSQTIRSDSESWSRKKTYKDVFPITNLSIQKVKERPV